jgi:anaphase-promoting complex subunit 2
VWNADDLATKLRVPDIALVRNALYFWNNLGVLKNLGDDWKLLEEVDKNEEPTVSHGASSSTFSMMLLTRCVDCSC